MQMTTIYVSYVETSEGEGVFTLLQDAAAAARAVEQRNPKLGHVTRIQKVSKRPDQPVIEPLCFSVQPLSPERSREIADAAVDWLMEEGYLEWRE